MKKLLFIFFSWGWVVLRGGVLPLLGGVRGGLLLYIFLFIPLLGGVGGGFSFAQECNIVYVTPNGATSGAAGTKANPAELLYGLTLANATDNKIYMAAGTYILFNPLNMLSDITLEGGFDPLTWEKSNSTTTTIYRDNSNVEPSPNRLVAIYCMGISNFRLQDLTIRSANAFGNGISSYGLYLDSCSNYDIVRCKIIAGNAGNGSNGANGANGIGGANGTAGENGDAQGPCCRAGGIGGSGSFPGSNAGGNGGDGGDRGTASCSWCGDPADATNGYPGQNGFGTGGGIGGNGGYKRITCIYPLNCAPAIHYGAPGVDGADGLPGIPGTDGTGAFAGGFFIPGTGTAGTAGTHGSGGGGGGGSGSLGGIPYDCLLGLPPNLNGSGAGGAGGGEGGQAAQGGLGGTGGGGSFAVYINNNGANGVIRDCQLTFSSAGLGGLGGIGGTGGLGGLGAAGGGQCFIGEGGNGGNGGNGGDGGPAGKGANGMSYDLYEDTSGVPVSLMNINTLQQPFVFVRYSGYTDAPVVFSTTATGTIDWYFGAGAVPSTGSGSPSTTSYTTTGRKTFTMVNNGIPYTYSEFIEIYGNGSGLNPTINSPDSTLCEGDTGIYTSSVFSAITYTWIIQSSTITDTISGSILLPYQFDSAGTYNVILQTTDSCAGVSFPDTFTVNVEPILLPSVIIQASETSNTVCDGATITFSATAADAGILPGYQWLVNGVAAGANSSTFSTSTLLDGDVVSCVVSSSLTCSAGIVDTSNSITITVIGIPSVSCTVDSSTTGEPTYFTAAVTSGGLPPFSYFWNFGDSLMGSGDSVAHIYTSPGTYVAQVDVVDSNGCSGSCTTFITISSELTAGFTASIFNGCAPLQVDFTNSSTNAITYLWEFGDGSTSVLENPTHIYTNPGTYTVTLNAYGGPGGDSASVTNQVLVLPSPVANFQAYPPIVQLGDTIFFADNSSDAWEWQWDFGDGNTDTVQNPTHVYASTGSYPVTLIVTNAYGCTDTIQKPSFISIVPVDSGGVGVNEFQVSSFKFQVYPNPFSSALNLELDLPEKGYLEVSLWNIQGRKVMEIEKREVTPGFHQIKHNLENSTGEMSVGLYFLEINYNGRTYYRKLIYNNSH